MVDKASSCLDGPKCVASEDKELVTQHAEPTLLLFYSTLFSVASVLEIVFTVSVSVVYSVYSFPLSLELCLHLPNELKPHFKCMALTYFTSLLIV